MMKYGFIKVASAVPMVKVGDVKYNVEQIENLTVQAAVSYTHLRAHETGT